MHKPHRLKQLPYSRGYTLLEISIVLVIIGLMVGGILVGQDLIGGAKVSAQIAQIGKYNQAVNAFYGKFGALPGDMNAMLATRFGFSARGTNAGEGDGNGVLEGYNTLISKNDGSCLVTGENGTLWVDLSHAGLIDNSFTTASETTPPIGLQSGSRIGLYFPTGKINYTSYVNTFSYGGTNYFGVSQINTLDGCYQYGNQPMTVAQAYTIDSKIDDGLPTTGTVTAQYAYAPGFAWSPPMTIYGTGLSALYVSFAASSTTCFDDAGSLSNPWQYSMTLQGGSGQNCSLSFQMQAGAVVR